MKQLTERFGKLILGLFLVSLGTFLNSCSGLGFQPWSVLNDGISKIFPITFGQANIIIGILILIIDLIVGEQLGLGTMLNISLIGMIVDMLNFINGKFNMIPYYGNILYKLTLCFAAVPITVLGIYFYMSVGMGTGPRDCLMVVITRRTRFPVGVCRLFIDGGALVIGWLMGGVVGIGTLIMVITKGPGLQLLFKMMKYDVKTINNETVTETLRNFRGVFGKTKSIKPL